MVRWPRQGTALAMGLLVLLGIGSIAFFNGSASGRLPVGYEAQGMYVYEANCASCHGFYAEGTMEGPALVGPGAATGKLSRDEMARSIESPTGSMPQPDLSRQDVADAIAYLQTIEAFGGA